MSNLSERSEKGWPLVVWLGRTLKLRTLRLHVRKNKQVNKHWSWVKTAFNILLGKTCSNIPNLSPCEFHLLFHKPIPYMIYPSECCTSAAAVIEVRVKELSPGYQRNIPRQQPLQAILLNIGRKSCSRSPWPLQGDHIRSKQLSHWLF